MLDLGSYHMLGIISLHSAGLFKDSQTVAKRCAALDCIKASNIRAICPILLRFTSEAEEGEEVLRLGLASGQVLNGGGQR